MPKVSETVMFLGFRERLTDQEKQAIERRWPRAEIRFISRSLLDQCLGLGFGLLEVVQNRAKREAVVLGGKPSRKIREDLGEDCVVGGVLNFYITEYWCTACIEVVGFLKIGGGERPVLVRV